jgi:long-subunit acyl-CoA synthetase (AMP-forming)
MEEREWPFKDVHTILSEKAQQHPSKAYIESPDQEQNITFEQTNTLCNRVANFLKLQDIKSNDKIALIGENSIETLIIFLGVLNYGAIVNPINVEESKEDIYRLLNLAKPRIVFHGKELTFDESKYRADLWQPYSYSDVESGPENEFFSSLNRYSPKFQSHSQDKDGLSTLIFTSGTTAMPKGVVNTRESIYYMAVETIDRLRITEQDIMLDYRAYSSDCHYGSKNMASPYVWVCPL